MSFAIADKTVLVTGANRGLGGALVDEALSRGAKSAFTPHPAKRLSSAISASRL